MTRFCKKAAAVFVSMSAALSMIPAMSASADGSDWNFTYFGTSVNASYNKLVEGSYEAGTVKLQSATFKADGSINKKGGKFVADSPADGASYYYTTIDPSTQNFVLQADITLDELNPKVDGQEGFALMARDKVWDSGKGGSCMSNLVSVAGTKLPYNGSDVKDAIGVRAYTGIFTPEASEENAISPVRYAWTNKKIAQGNTYRLRLEKTDNAYITTQYDPETGDTIGSYTYYIPAKDSYATSITGYDELDDPLSYQDKDNAYIAMVVARGVNATFSNITFSTSEWNASNWTPQPTKYIDPTLTITSAATAAGGEYNLMFRTNADGAADVYCDEELLASGIEVMADTMMSYTYPMTGSEATYSVVFTPQEGYALSAYEVLSNYDEISRSINVTQNELGEGEYIYASPDGSSTNGGTSTADAVDIVTALEYAKAGQTIILESGTYTLADALTISRGRNGKSGAPITVTTSDGEFATIDFRNSGSGLNLWGNYWNISNINICNSTGKGMQIYGSHNTVERMNFWNNGNTGLQIAGSSADDKSIWPAYNNVINCTSMNNADKALEDADGFAAKLTCGAGNVFDGCIAAYNADDGWDLFAKVATGQIGAVEIKNSVTYKNGYLMVTEGSTAASFELASVTCDSLGNLSFSSGVEIEAGNGNGFKMGGSNIPGAHSLSGSTAFNNKAKGIDSNSCPDISISDSVSYNNGSYNVALYTGNASAVTAYSASGIISYRSGEYANVKENIKLQSQEEGDIYNSSNYFWSDAASSSANADGVTVSDDWFESLDTSVVPSRKADGSIDMHGLLVLKECTVTFILNGSTHSTAKVEYGKAVTLPTIETPDDKKFFGWYIDAEMKTLYNATAPVTADITLYAAEKAKADTYIDGEPVTGTVADILKNLKADTVVVTLGEDADISKLTFPKAKDVKEIIIDGGGSEIHFTGNAALKPNQKLTLVNVEITAEKNGKPQNIAITAAKGGLTLENVTLDGKKVTITSTNGDLTLGNVSGSELTVKGGAKSTLTVNGEVGAMNVTGFGTVVVNGTLTVTKTLTVNELKLADSAVLRVENGAAVTVKKDISGNGTIGLASGFKPVSIGGEVNGTIKLTGDKMTDGTQIFKTKADLTDKVNVSEIAPAVTDGEYSYGLYSKSGNVYLRAFRMQVGEQYYCEWADIVNGISKVKAAAAVYSVKLLGDVDLGKTFALPAKGKYAGLTIDGNGHTITFSGSAITLTGDITLKNVTVKATAKNGCTIKLNKFRLDTGSAELVNCTVK